ncbi:hypothetical protein [Absidia glauca]|uniref:Uncharacterized protein n=1 Tax=Absidia glauca TaxID=4829 RepID=A0A168S8Z3_ABSGL|nr:hypothetical protein [Absidia glauca]
MVAFLLAPSVSSSSCGVAASSVLPETMPGWQPSAAVDPALTVLPAVSVSPSAPVLCSSFSPRPLDDDDNSDRLNLTALLRS